MCLWGKCINDLCADCCYGKKSGIDVEFLVTMFFFLKDSFKIVGVFSGRIIIISF